MVKWEKTGRYVYGDGGSDTIYETANGRFCIESRKRAIPHASRGGYWMHTTFFLFDGGDMVKEFYTLKDAKEKAEEIAHGKAG